MFNIRQSQVHGAQFTVSVLSEEEDEASRVTTAEVSTDQSIVSIRSGSQSERGQSYLWLPPLLLVLSKGKADKEASCNRLHVGLSYVARLVHRTLM